MDSPVAVAFLVLVGPLLLAILTYWMRQRERKIDIARQNEVAAEAAKVAEQAAADRVAAEKRQDDVAEQAAEVARLLQEGGLKSKQHGHIEGEVVEKSLQSRTLVTLSHANGERQEVLLAGVPSIGDHIRLKTNGRTTPPFIVEYVLWVEGEADPVVVVVVGPAIGRKDHTESDHTPAEARTSASTRKGKV